MYFSMGREQTAGQHGRSAGDLAAGWLHTDWIQEPDEVQHARLWRGCRNLRLENIELQIRPDRPREDEGFKVSLGSSPIVHRPHARGMGRFAGNF